MCLCVSKGRLYVWLLLLVVVVVALANKNTRLYEKRGLQKLALSLFGWLWGFQCGQDRLVENVL